MPRPLVSVIAVLLLICASDAFARVEGFATGGLHRDVNGEPFVGTGGGVLLTAKWLSLGAQGDAFFSLPYVAGRLTLLAQGNLLDRGGIRPFVQIGTSVGELKGRMYGLGVDLRRREARVGVRTSLQVYMANVWNDRPVAQSSANVGVIWR